MMKLSNWTEERVSGVFKGGGWGKSGTLFLVLAHLKPCTKERKQRLFAIDIHLSWYYQAVPHVRVHICLLDDHLSGWLLQATDLKILKFRILAQQTFSSRSAVTEGNTVLWDQCPSASATIL